MAQEEAGEWARKCRQRGMVVPLAMGLLKFHKFNIITTENENDEEEIAPPFIVLWLGIERLEIDAFLDSKADGNTISYKLLT